MQALSGQSSITQTLGTTGLGARCLRPDSERRVRLFVYGEPGAQVVTLYEGLPVTIGRSTMSGLSIADTSLSREHARFELNGGQVAVVDLGSTNGTRIGGKRCDACELAHGSEVRLGRVSVVVHIDPPRPPELGDIVPAERFQQLLAAELTRAELFARSLVLLRLEPDGGAPFDAWYQGLAKLLRPVDQVGFWRTTGLQVCLPEATTADGLLIAQRFLSIAQNGVRIGLASYPEHARNLDELTEAATGAERTATRGRVVVAKALDTPSRIPLIAESDAMQALLRQITKFAPREMTTLIQGETGAGKEVVARLIHEQGGRREGPFETINCGAIPASLLESALFGHEKGAFTGADKQVMGVFERAHGGTILLDEIGELSAPAQAALLRVLEARTFTRVGGMQSISVDVRVIAATHRRLDVMCENATFRRDLWFRLNGVTLEVPPLRARQRDVLPLAEYFRDLCARRERLTAKPFSASAQALLERYAWPGNVRELKNEVERALVLSDGSALEPSDFSAHLAGGDRPDLEPASSARHALAERSADSISSGRDGGARAENTCGALDFLHSRDLRAEVERYEVDLIRATLEHCGGNQTEAAKLLRLPRRTLVYKLKALGITAEE